MPAVLESSWADLEAAKYLVLVLTRLGAGEHHGFDCVNPRSAVRKRAYGNWDGGRRDKPPASVRCMIWSVMRAMRGDMTTVQPGARSAGSWYVSDLPPPK